MSEQVRVGVIGTSSYLKDQPAFPSFYDGLKVQEVLDAAIESHRKGCWVSLQPQSAPS
jgi:predicted dehydrogenase